MSRSNLSSALGFGGSAIAGVHRPVSEEDAAAAVEEAWRLGVRRFDTAPFYGAGLGERRLGAALAGRPRDEFALSTKVGRLVVEDGFERDYSRDGVLRSLEASRARTDIDRFDLVLVHDPEDHVAPALDEALPALFQLRDEGAIGAVGVGINLVEPLQEILARTDLDAVMLANRWTLLDRTGLPVLEDCAARGIAVLAAAPFNSGILAEPEPRDDATFGYRPAPPELLARARAYAAACAAYGVELPAAALRFPLRHPAVAAVVAGLGDAAEVRAAHARLQAPIPAELWVELDALGA
ncbi:MAG TPA: aldo/keto reductase [Gaiellaceae bacterium]|nr:aldo/keto reductase [Gaiellaceae bacterium]